MNHLAHLARDSERFGSVLAGLDGAVDVPSCPDFSADDLLWHLTEVQAFWSDIVARRARDFGPLELDRPAARDELLDRFREASTRLVNVLGSADPATEVWTWSDDKTVGFVRRRQAHEALIHRVDAELTAGLHSAVDPDLAADGVDELITVMLTGVPPWGRFRAGGEVVAVEATDLGRRWVMELGPISGTSPDSGNVYEDLPAGELTTEPPTARIGAPAAELDLWLWGRIDGGGIGGDEAAKAAVRALAADSTQ